MSKSLFVTAIVLGALLLVQMSTPAYALRALYHGDKGPPLSTGEQQDVQAWLLQHHTPELTMAIMEQMLVVAPDATDNAMRVTVREATGGELLFCLVDVVRGPNIWSPSITQSKGDGSFSGPPAASVPFSWGTGHMYHGEPSVNQRMVLDLEYTKIV